MTKTVCIGSGEAEIRVGVKIIFKVLFPKLRQCLYPDLPGNRELGYSSVNESSCAYGKWEGSSLLGKPCVKRSSKETPGK